MSGKEMIRKFKQAKWNHVRTTGSHYIFEKNGEIEAVPHHIKELKKGIQEKLLKRLKEVD